jgi:hypothetical protein
VKESQLVVYGTQSFGITGKHFSRIYTDDIINMSDRISKAERTATDYMYQELQNIRMSGGVIINTGTPWHRDDTFRLMPNPMRWTVYETGLMSGDEIRQRRNNMTASLFSANYELKHISDEASLFTDPTYGKYPEQDSIAQIDCAYGGDNTTALTVITSNGDNLHAYGKVFIGHVQNHYFEIQAILERYKVGTLHNETNADKGYFAKEFRQYWKLIRTYHEGMNKHLKISTYMKRDWNRIIWDDRTDPAYMEQIVDYQEGQDPDDAPDSASSLLREMNRGRMQTTDRNLFGL